MAITKTYLVIYFYHFVFECEVLSRVTHNV